MVKLLEPDTKEVRVLQGHVEGVIALDFSPDGRTLASIDGKGNAKLWNVAAAREVLALKLQGRTSHWNKYSVPLLFSPDGRHLAIGEQGDDPLVRIFAAPRLENKDRN